MNKKSILFLALVAIAAVIALSACGNKTNNNANNAGNAATGTAPAGTPAAGGGEAKSITVNAKNFEFEPAEFQAKVGDKLTISLNNTAGNHGLAIPELGVNLKNGESATVTLDKAGTYDFNCSIQCGSGHDNMVGKLTVTET